MNINEKTAQLVVDLERIVGNCCYNGDSYNGYTGEYGAHFRYPVMYPGVDGKMWKSRGYIGELDYKNVDQMHYKFGANQLYIGAALIRVLNELEDRYDISFDELVEQ